MGDNVNTGSKGVFPTNGAKTEGTIQPVKVVTNNTPATAPVVSPSAPAQEAAPNTGSFQEVNAGETYALLETKNHEGQVSGIIELDLISFREKGKENRYLQLQTTGVGEDGNQVKISLAIDNESDFNVFKSFVSKLNWND